MNTKPATILASQVRMMKSKYTNRKYRITISLPYSYIKSDRLVDPFDKPLEKWPVVYVTDGNWYSGMITDMVRCMAWCGRITDAIIVGIGYAENPDPQESWRDMAAWRNSDLVPVRDEGVEKYYLEEFVMRPSPTGGAHKFLNFLQHELIPAIEKEFRADPRKRVLAGHSYGGTFAAFTLFEASNLFDSYIIGSPSLTEGDSYLFKREELFAKRRKKLAAKIYLYVGELDGNLNDVTRFGTLLEGRQYKGLTLIRQTLPDEDHCTAIPLGFQAGLRITLRR
jgi:predicted alpha/beta superfamily hydrolase